MRQLKISVGLLVLASCLVTVLMQLWHRYTYVKSHHNLIKLKAPGTRKPKTEMEIKHVNLNEVYHDDKRDSGYDELNDLKPIQNLDTPGCKIPLNTINYVKDMGKLANKNRNTCGRRAVFINKFDTNKVQVLIKKRYIKRYLRKSAQFDCCYQFLMTPSIDSENKPLRYTKCVKFQDREIIELQSDYIKVKCYEYEKLNKSRKIYDDVYAFTRKTNLKTNFNNCSKRFNVLMIGMDSLSLSQMQQTMTKTVKFFKENFWLSYRAYHKIDDNTFQNLIAVLTGMRFEPLHHKCAKRMDDCNDLFIWSKFKDIGYVTACGEDNFKMSNTFTRDYDFKQPPTHHNMKYFFQKSEDSTMGSKCLKCTGKVSSAKQLLNFALDFASTYRRDNFLGLFRISSYGQNENCGPWNTDSTLENFFNQLAYTGVLVNTFVIFYSEHGIRVGPNRLKVESYYDERLPVLYIWIPYTFKSKYLYSFKAATDNQFRFVTPYDVFNTLEEIRRISSCSSLQTNLSQGCFKCGTLFEGIDLNRTCQDVGINEKWCSCHNLYHLSIEDSEGFNSVTYAVTKLQTKVSSIKTRRCWSCKNLSLQTVHRIHFYYNEDKISLYYVVAFSTKPGNFSYEATVLLKDNVRELVGPISAITQYRGTGDCVLRFSDRIFCVCNRTC